MSSLGDAVSFLTPFGKASTPTSDALDYFPLVGSGLGIALGAAWWLLSRAWPKPVAAAAVVVLDLAATGMMHFDGLVDSADGLLGHMDRTKRLAVMSEPCVGAFGVGAGTTVLLLRCAALASLRPSPLLLGSLWCLSRTGMALIARTQPYAREHGLASAFLDRASQDRAGQQGPAQQGPGQDRAGQHGAADRPAPGRRLGGVGGAALAGTTLSAVMAIAWRGAAGPVSLAAAVVAGAGVVSVGRQRLGGFTGDVLGAAGVIAETAGLVAAAARW